MQGRGRPRRLVVTTETRKLVFFRVFRVSVVNPRTPHGAQRHAPRSSRVSDAHTTITATDKPPLGWSTTATSSAPGATAPSFSAVVT